jgi:tRNA modification GTPase
VDGEEVIDDAIVAVRTDEDGVGYVEFTTHGGPRIVQRLLLALNRNGARIESADEMSSEAWPAENLIEREVYALLPHAQTRRAAAWLLRQRVSLPAAIEEIRGLLRDTPSVALERIRGLIRTHGAATWMLRGFSVAIVGLPNAGKSTLANALCGKNRVLVSDLPGTTRDYVSEPVAIDGVPLTLVDTAGVRHSEDAIEAEAVLRARRQAGQAGLRLVVIDAAVPLAEDSRGLLGTFTPDDPSLLVLTKGDLPPLVRPGDLPGGWPSVAVVVSAVRGEGIHRLGERIVAAMGLSRDFDRQAAAFTGRQVGLLERASSGDPGDLRHILEGLKELVGHGEGPRARA